MRVAPKKVSINMVQWELLGPPVKRVSMITPRPVSTVTVVPRFTKWRLPHDVKVRQKMMPFEATKSANQPEICQPIGDEEGINKRKDGEGERGKDRHQARNDHFHQLGKAEAVVAKRDS